MSYTCIRIEGGLLSPDFLERIHEMDGQKPGDFALDGHRPLVDEISSVWGDARIYWDAFQRRLARAHGESLTTMTREQWIIPLLEALGYQLTFQRRAAEADGRTYLISHRTGDDDSTPAIHIVGCDQELGSRPPSGRGQFSPHALVQDYLNRTEHLWGLVTNGHLLRLLRDSSYFTRPTYIEFDLQQMLDGERLDEFILFYRLVHRSRLPRTIDDAPECWLERYHQHAIEQGGRIRDGLRDAVEQAILTLANGFLRHPKNQAVRERIRSGQLPARQFYQRLLYLIYRFLFLMVAEERNLLEVGLSSAPSVAPSASFYRDYVSISRLRALADEPLGAPERFDDLYLGLRTLFYVLCQEECATQLGLPPLNGELFHELPGLDDAHLNNRDLLTAIWSLSYFTPSDERVRRRINYAALDVEELGSVYESLLDLQPCISEIDGRIEFSFGQGTERKATGSYYTRPELVQELIKSALEPVIEERLREADQIRNPQSAIRNERERVLLSLKVCDPACGSGHFLLAAARRIGRELAKVRTGDDEPSPDAVRDAVRDAITHCIYGVDKNPLAVDLCKVALWIEGHQSGKPLTFLDHRIRCGDSLVGVFDLSVLEDGIPDEAYTAVTGDDKTIARLLKKQNRKEREGKLFLPFDTRQEMTHLLDAYRELETLSDDTPEQVRRKREAFERLHQEGAEWWRDQMACHLWTAAFFVELNQSNQNNRRIPTTEDLRGFMERPTAVDKRLTGYAETLAAHHGFFHWPLEFPEVFSLPRQTGEGRGGGGGFDVVLSNPPWEMLQLDPQEFFVATAPLIAAAPNMAARERLIARLAEEAPPLYATYMVQRHDTEACQKFVHEGGRFPLTSYGRINLMALFAELARQSLNPNGHAGIIVPTGISTDSFNQYFFADLIEKRALASLFDFENREALFPGVHRNYKFCLLTMSGRPSDRSDFAFFLTRAEQLHDEERRFTLAPEDLALLNPNTRTCPVFRTGADAELTKKIYHRVPVLVNEQTEENPWGFKGLLMFMMNTASGLFKTADDFPSGVPADHLPLYEGKMIQAFDHRAASVVVNLANVNRQAQPDAATPEQYTDPTFTPTPRYWVHAGEVDQKLSGWPHGWLIGFKDVTSPTNERTAIFSLLPKVAVGHTMPIAFLHNMPDSLHAACFLANVNSLAFDYATRQKIGGIHLSFGILNQLPILLPSAYTPTDIAFIAPRVLELVYTAWDIKPFADDVWRDADERLRALIQKRWDANRTATGGHEWNPPEWAEIADDGIPLPPFKWDEGRRAQLRAELDAYFARLYGLTRDELRYILDPADVYGPDFPGETFRVLKDKELRQLGEYRTRRLVLEAWDAMEVKPNAN
jgi:hypothetical protein